MVNNEPEPGFLVAVNELQMQQDQLKTSKSADELKQAQAYDENEYQPIQLDRQLREYQDLGSQ